MRSEKHSVNEQIRNGLFVACRLIVGFLVFLLAVSGLAIVFSTAPTQPSRLFVGWAAIVAASIVMFMTAHRWGGFIAGFFFLPGAFRAFGSFVGGYDYSYPPRPLSRFLSAMAVIYCIAVIALVWRFIGSGRKRIAMTYTDRTALTLFVLGFGTFMVHQPQSDAGLIVGIAGLFYAWIVSRWRHPKRNTHHLDLAGGTPVNKS